MLITKIKLNTILYGKSEEKLKSYPNNFFDGIITDPPYGMGFMSKGWDTFDSQMIKQAKENYDATPSKNLQRPAPDGYIRKVNKPISSISTVAGSYDLSISGQRHFQDWFYIIAVEMLRVAKPGSFLFCFGGTRTYHRVTCAIEDAGWIIKDQMMWIYGEGFPKSTNIGKQIGDQEWDGYGTGLKPGWEPIIVAMKPLEQGLTYAQNAKKWGVAGLNIDGGRVGTEQRHNRPVGFHKNSFNPYDGKDGNGTDVQGRWPANVILSHSPDCVCVGTKKVGTGEYKKHIVEDAKLSWKNSNKDINVTAYGQETVEVYACVPDCPIRIMDGQSGLLHSGNIKSHKNKKSTFLASKEWVGNHKGDSGGASRFFYCAKAKRSEKEAGLIEFAKCVKCGKFDSKFHIVIVDGKEKKEKCIRNNHPTVKPLGLMRYLINLIKMPNEDQVVLDPFCGSGSTLVVAEQLGINYIGIDQDFDNVLISMARIE